MSASSIIAPHMTALAQRLCDLKRLEVTEQHADRLERLAAKLSNDQSVLTFCGHFSAGKSTLINRLAGNQILPASPIPTSSNQVLITHGEPGATVHFRDRGPLDLAPSELHRLAALCADGDQVEAIEIRHPLAHVPEGLWVMDTPGIDSTDEAHRIVTESALYLADAVCYVMDYNHVQSEVNLQFARAVAEWGKPLYLVVNQIDKHVELEIPFARFRQSVIDAFAAWGVHPDGLFFTSLREREPDPTHNEWDALLTAIRSLGEHREQLLTAGVWNSAVHVMAEEGRVREQSQAPERERLLRDVAAGGAGPDLRREQVRSELERLAGQAADAAEGLSRDAASILSNAPLFPYTTKALAERYLQARNPHFRAGFFASAARTQAEVASRLQAFHADLAEKVTAHIHWHLHELLLKFAAQDAVRDEVFEAEARALRVTLGPDMLAGLVKPQSLIASEYRLQYIKDVTAETQLRYRRAIKPLIDRAAALVASRARRNEGPLHMEAALLDSAIAAAQRLAEMDEAAEVFRAAWSAVLGDSPATAPEPRPQAAAEPAPAHAAPAAPAQAAAEPAPAYAAPAAPAQAAAEPVPAHAAPAARAHATPASTIIDSAAAQTDGPAIHGREIREEAARSLRNAAALLTPLTGMARTAADLHQRAGRLADSRFTVALFGAFSAGKSSFANALMGLQLLPASPNPTTAVITRVTAPTPEWPHGHVHVIWKSADQLRLEVERALGALDLPATGDIAADLATGARQSREATASLARPHAAFLAAAARGYAAVQHSLGREEAAGLAQLASLVADEQRSCFVAEITLYIDCPVTRQGITLVDTPGADSINARHTDVAFDYIKNADAILFVTYYNHAFSRADSDLLTQLGRVKDSFALDKMFFVINAADLAEDSEELALVTTHVRRNLQACGIRQARIFPVSSQTALWTSLKAAGRLPQELAAKLDKRSASGMERFAAEFYRFIVTDLSQMAVDSAFAELGRAIATIGSWLDASRADDGARALRLQALQTAEAGARKALGALDAGPEAAEVEREIDELLYYVRCRVLRERFREGFTLAFNPSVLRQDSPDLKRSLRDALTEVLRFVSFDLAQELRATALRVENVVNRQAERVQQRAVVGVTQHLPQWSGPLYSPVHPPMPTLPSANLNPEEFLQLLGLFRSPERFFAGGGRAELAEALIKGLEAPVAAYLRAAREALASWYGDAFNRKVSELQAELTAAVADHAGGMSAALTAAGESEELASTLERLRI